MSKTDLFGDFPEVSAKAWKQKIQFDLKGADYNEKLVWESPEGIKVKPFYHADDIMDIPKPLTPFEHKWNIGQTIYAANVRLANTKGLGALRRGAESLMFTIPSKEIKIEELLKGIDTKITPIYFELQFLSISFIEQIIDFVGTSKSNIHLNIDIIGNLARDGNWFFNLKKDHEILANILKINKTHKLSSIVSVDVSLYHNAGANRVQQLAYALAHANEYLNHFHKESDIQKIWEEGAGIKPVIIFKVAVDTNYFFEVAKLRALRLLWKTLAAEYPINVDCQIIAVPARRNKTLYDYNTNMLRTTTECMAAIVGAADVICNTPYDAIYHKDNEFGERIARNQLLILKHESYFDKVSNPADGSYYIESLTKEMAEKALVLFKNIESGGGFLKQLKEHTIQKKIKENAKKEQERFSRKEEVLLGTNTYQNPSDHMKDTLELYPFVKTNTRKTLIEPIIERRLAEELEQKRLKDE